MHGHTGGRRRLSAHLTEAGTPILTSAICCCCEDNAGTRMSSWHAAQQSQHYDNGSRRPLADGICAFCRKRIRSPK